MGSHRQHGGLIMQILAIGGPYASAPVNAPTSLSNVPSTTSVAISFTAPTNDGGSAITNYEYSFNGSSWTALSPADATSPITVSGLTENTAYSIYLRAVNIIGSGPGSSATSFTTTRANFAVEILTIAGGGGGPSYQYPTASGGGGGGGLATGTPTITPGTVYTITVGGASTASSGLGISSSAGANASGSTGGASGGSTGAGGNAGGPNNGGTGGLSSISGSSTYYGGGGGGGGVPGFNSHHGSGGAGGGGAGQNGSGGGNTNGTANTGGGGGGSCPIAFGSAFGTASSGGSGRVVIAYVNSKPTATSTTGSPVYSSVSRSGYHVYTFNGSGSITF
jgi:hypothetical protein